MTSSSLLMPQTLDFQFSDATQAKITATASVFTFSGLSGNDVELKGVATPTDVSSAATKQYVDSVATGLIWVRSVRAASTGNIVLASGVAKDSVLDGVTLATGDRILLKNQTTAIANGIYVVAASGAPSRAIDFATGNSVKSHSVFVEEGTINGDQGYICTNDAGAGVTGDIVNTANLSFTQFTGLGQVTAGNALSKSGNTMHVEVDNSSLQVNADALQVKALGVTNAMLAGSVANAKLVNSAVTVTAGDGLQTGGSVSLGSAVTVDVDSTVIRVAGGQTIAGTETFSGALSLSGTAQESGLIQFANCTAPATKTNKLYAVGGDLTWNDIRLNQTSYVNAGNVAKMAYYTDATNVDDAIGITVSSTSGTNDTLTLDRVVSATGNFTGDVDVAGNFDMQTNSGIIRMGSALALLMQHTGAFGTLHNVVGDLLIRNIAATSDTIIKIGDDAAATAFKVQDGAGVDKFLVKSDGWSKINGSLTVDNVKVDGNTIGHTSDTDLLTFAANQLLVTGNVDVTSGVDVSGAAITTSAGFTNTAGEVLVSAGNVQLNDGVVLSLGSDDDVAVTHSGSHLAVTCGTGNMNFENTATTSHYNFKLGNTNHLCAFMVRDANDGVCFQVKSDATSNAKGLFTTEAGHIHSGGEYLVSGGTVRIADNKPLYLGTGAGGVGDFTMVHNGTDTLLTEGTGDLGIINSVATKDVYVKLGSTTSATVFRVKNSSNGDAMSVTAAGTTVVGDTLHVNSTSDASTVSNGALVCAGGISVAKRIYSGANIHSAAFVTHSDRKLKKNIVDVTEEEANQISNLKPKNFYWKDADRGANQQTGFIAQDVEKIMPQHVIDSGEHLSVNYAAIIPLLVKKIQMLESKIETLSKQVETKNRDIRYNAY